MGIVVLLAASATIIVLVGTLALIHGLLHPPRRTIGSALAQGLPADPGEMGLRFTEKTVTLPDGSTTLLWLVTGNKSDGPLIIATHGFGDSRYGLLATLTDLLPFASQIVLYDMRGHGESTAPISRLATTETSDLLHLLYELDAADPGKSYVFYGASMGAGVSIVAASDDHSGRVIGVIAEGPYRYPVEPVAGFLRSRRWPTFPFGFLAFAHIRFWLGGFENFDRALRAQDVKCPLLVLAGDCDRICDYTSAQAIARAAPHGQLVTFVGGAHLDLSQYDEVLYRQALTTFFESLKQASTTEPEHPISSPPTGAPA
jgi:pimeloyl-ACP methyl ester carboxylesterase